MSSVAGNKERYYPYLDERDEGEAVGKTAKPKFFSKEWFKTFFSALKFHKYSARDWGIWNLSTASTLCAIAGIWKPIIGFVSTNAPWLVTALSYAKACVIAFCKWLVAFVVAVVHILAG